MSRRGSACPSRRAVLAGLAGVASGLAGCSAPDTRGRRPPGERNPRLAVETARLVGSDAVEYRATVRDQPTGGSPGRVEVACVNRRDEDLRVSAQMGPPLPPVGGTEPNSVTGFPAAHLLPADEAWVGPWAYDDHAHRTLDGCWSTDGRVGVTLEPNGVRLAPEAEYAIEYLFLIDAGYCAESLTVDFREPIGVGRDTATAQVVLEATARG